jgi:hypothetical protein
MDEFLKQLIESSTEISLEKRTQILQLIDWNIRKSIRSCKHDIMAKLIDQANKNSTIYDAVVQINKLYEDEETEKKTN